MACSNLLVSLARAASAGDRDALRSTTEALTADERAKNHHVLADHLQRALSAGPVTPPPLTTSGNLPNPSGRDAIIELEARTRLEVLLLPLPVKESARQLVEEHRRADVLRAKGREPRRRVLHSGAALAGGVLAALLAFSPAQAQTWTGAVSTDWATAGNWTPAGAPGPGGAATINNGALANQPVLNAPSAALANTNVSAGLLTLNAPLTSTNVTLSGTGAISVLPGGDIAGNIFVGAGAQLRLATRPLAGATLTLNGTGPSNDGALRHLSGNQVLSAPITLGSATRINSDAARLQTNGAIGGAGQNLTVGGAGVLIINGGLNTGAGTLTKDGSGQLALNSTNSFTGDVTVNAGRLQISFAAGSFNGPVNGAIGDLAALTLNGGEVQINQNETIGSLAGAAGTRIFNNKTVGVTLTTGGNNANTSYAGMIEDGNGPTSLTKQGTGTFALTGANSYTGLTTISAGALQVGNGGTTGTLGTGNVVNNATLAFNRTDPAATPFTVANVISGNGTISQIGMGVTALTGASGAFAGTTNVDAGTLLVNGTLGNAAATLNVNAGGTLTTTGVINGGLSSTGVANAQGTIAGGITNSGVFTITGPLSSSGADVANTGAGTFTLGAGAAFTNVATFANTAAGADAVRINGGATLAAATVNNLAGTFTNLGAVNAANVRNAGGATFANSGVVNASTRFTNQAGGVVTNSGSIIAPTIANLGLMTSTGTINATSATTFENGGTFNGSGVFSSAASNNSGTFTVTGNLGNGALPVSGPFNNTGLVDLVGGSFTGLSVFNNAGTLRAASGSNFTLGAGTFNNQATGLVTLANGRTGDQLTIGGNYVGAAGSRIAVDVDLSRADGAGRSDLVTVTGAAAGASTIEVNALNNGRVSLAAPIDVLRVGPGSTLQAELEIERRGFFAYNLRRNGDVYQITSQFNSGPVTGVAAGVAGALTSLQAGFHQPASAIISRPGNCRPNQLMGGPFLRMNAGDTRLTNRIESGVVGGRPEDVVRTSSSSRTRFSGIQGGLDLGLCNVNGTGWNIHAGLMGGHVETESSNRAVTPSPVQGGPSTSTRTSLSVEVPFFGGYAFLTNGPFTAEFNVRRDFFNARVSSFDPISGIQFVGPRQKLKGDSLNFNVAMSYRLEFGDVWYVEPGVGLSRGDNSLGRLTIASGANDFIAFKDSTSLLGRIGVNIGYGMQVSKRLLAAPFINATLWHEFGKDNRATATFGSSGNQSFDVQTDRVGTFGQLGGGVQFQVAGTPLVGFVRGDVRFGCKIGGQAFNAGLRLQF